MVLAPLAKGEPCGRRIHFALRARRSAGERSACAFCGRRGGRRIASIAFRDLHAPVRERAHGALPRGASERALPAARRARARHGSCRLRGVQADRPRGGHRALARRRPGAGAALRVPVQRVHGRALGRRACRGDRRRVVEGRSQTGPRPPARADARGSGRRGLPARRRPFAPGGHTAGWTGLAFHRHRVAAAGLDRALPAREVARKKGRSQVKRGDEYEPTLHARIWGTRPLSSDPRLEQRLDSCSFFPRQWASPLVLLVEARALVIDTGPRGITPWPDPGDIVGSRGAVRRGLESPRPLPRVLAEGPTSQYPEATAGEAPP